MNAQSAEAEAPIPRSLAERRRKVQCVFAILAGVFLIGPLGFVFTVRAVNVGRTSYIKSVGTLIARWRHQEQFEQQYAVLLACLDAQMTRVERMESYEAADSCWDQAWSDLGSASPLAVHMLVPAPDGRLEWCSVGDNSTRPGACVPGEGAREGLSLVSIDGWLPGYGAWAGIQYVRTLPQLDSRSTGPRAYAVLIDASDMRGS